MKLILTRAVDNLGQPGDVVEVKSGYGRNYLLPQGLAIAWTKGGAAQVDRIKRARQVRKIHDLEHAHEVKQQLEGLSVHISARAGDNGQLFGRVTAKDLAKAIKAAGGPNLDWHAIDIAEPIKHVGDHEVAVPLHDSLTASVSVSVAAE
ncbi:MAG: 50S ribosomal protein L9 [Actinobacteria bacterium]|nr:50S ribosomal protein L9 [Actinomycetota bacterium]